MELRISSVTLLALLAAIALPTAAASTLNQTGPSSQIQIAPPSARHSEPPSADLSAEELERKGDELRGEKAFLDALDYLRAAASKNTKNAGVLNKIGIVQLQMAHYPEARKSFEAAIRLNRGYADAHNNLGVDYYLSLIHI